MRYLLLIPIVLLSGCAILPSMSSKSYQPGTKFDYNFYDEGSGLRYYVANDDSSIFISLNSTDLSTASVLRREGVTIYFDTLGKKNKEMYFKYPAGHQGGMPGPPPQGEAPPQGQGQQTQFQGQPGQMQGQAGQFPGMNGQQMPVASDAVFFKDGQSNIFNITLDDCGICVTSKQDALGGITYNITIPIDMISAQGMAALEKLSVGIVGSQPENMMGPGGGGMGGPGGGMGPGGGGGGGNMPQMGGGGGGMGGPGGGGPGGGGPGGPGGPGGAQSASKIDIWFKLELQH